MSERAAVEEWERVSCWCGAWAEEPKAGKSVRDMLGPTGVDRAVGGWGGKESPGLARVGAENWHDHMMLEAVPGVEKSLWYVIRTVHAAQGMTELQVCLEGSQSSCEQDPELN